MDMEATNPAQDIGYLKESLAIERDHSRLLALALSRRSESLSWRCSRYLTILRSAVRRPSLLGSRLRDGRLIAASGRFDPVHYLQQAPDVAYAGLDPLAHYLVAGADEGRDPSRDFSTRAYRAAHPELAGRNPFAHWLTTGMPAYAGQPRQRAAAPPPGPAPAPQPAPPAAAPAPAPAPAPQAVPAAPRVRQVRPGATPVSIVIPTLNGGELFRRSLAAIEDQDYDGAIQIVVIDSASDDGTPELASAAGAEVARIERRQFHHARTRQMALSLASHDLLVYFVQDAIPADRHWLSRLVAALAALPEVVACYGRQEPHDDADLYARFETSHHGAYLGDEARVQAPAPPGTVEGFGEALFRYRFDNVCAIYRRSALAACPFPVIPFGEDLAWAKAALERGWSVLYQPTVRVRHSHNRPPRYRFQRGFVDTVCCARILRQSCRDWPLLQDEGQLDALAALAESTERRLLEYCAANGLSRVEARQLTAVLPPPPPEPWNRHLVGHATSLLSMVGHAYPDESPAAYADCVRQAVQSTHGASLGDILGLHELAGQVPAWMSARLDPLFRGV